MAKCSFRRPPKKPLYLYFDATDDRVHSQHLGLEVAEVLHQVSQGGVAVAVAVSEASTSSFTSQYSLPARRLTKLRKAWREDEKCATRVSATRMVPALMKGLGEYRAPTQLDDGVERLTDGSMPTLRHRPSPIRRIASTRPNTLEMLWIEKSLRHRRRYEPPHPGGGEGDAAAYGLGRGQDWDVVGYLLSMGCSTASR